MTDGLNRLRYAGALIAAGDELDRQHELWGEQNHPLLGSTVDKPWVLRTSYASLADRQKKLNDYAVENDSLGWDDILLEEVYELLSEEDPDKQYTEAIQVAAVALNIAISNRRNLRKGGSVITYKTQSGKVVRFRMPPAPISVVDVVEVDGKHAGEIERDGANRFIAYPIGATRMFRVCYTIFEAAAYLAEVAKFFSDQGIPVALFEEDIRMELLEGRPPRI